MQDKSKNWIVAGLMGAVLSLAGVNALAKPKNLENVANPTKIDQVAESNEPAEEPNSIEYNVIKEVIVRDFLENYLNEITPKSNNFKKLRKSHGKKGLLEEYCSAHELTLNLAFDYQDKEVPKEAYVALGEQLSEKQNNTSEGSNIDYLDEEVSKAFANWGEYKTKNFKRLFAASKKVQTPELKTKKQRQEYIRQLHNLAYTREGYAKYVLDQNKANDKLYSSMKKTLSWIEKIFGDKEIKTIAKMTRNAYSRLLIEYFSGKKQ